MGANIAGAAAAADHVNGGGLLVASWAGSPALSHMTAALPGWMLAAGLAWNPAGCQHGQLFSLATGCCSCLAAIVSHHGLLDDTGVAGQVLLDFGRAECAVEESGRTLSGQLQTTRFMALILNPASGLAGMEAVTADQLASVIQTVR